MKTKNISDTHYSLTEFRVRYAETDAMGIVYHANYLPWFEMGRTDLGHKIDAPYTMIEKRGIHYPVVEAFCQYKNAAYYDDSIVVKSWICQVRSRSFVFEYEVYRKTDEKLLVTGHTKHIVINGDKKLTKLPDDLYQIYLKFDVNRL